jgi:hypothetical protein
MPLYEELVRRALAAREKADAAHEDSRRVRALARLLREAHAGKTLLVHCAWCDKLRVRDEWLDVSAVGGGSLRIARSLIRRSSHGICPDCFQRVSEEGEVLAASSHTSELPSQDAAAGNWQDPEAGGDPSVSS